MKQRQDTDKKATDEKDQRILELETQLAFQEDSLQKLNDVLVNQQQRLDALEVAVRHYEKRLQEVQHGVGGDAEPSLQDQIPPHY